MHEKISAFKGKQKVENQERPNHDERFLKTSKFSASFSVKDMEKNQIDHYPLADGSNKFKSYP